MKVEYVAYRAGYHSASNFYAALAKHTGLTPSALRELSLSAVQTLFDGCLETNPARLVVT